MFSGQNLSQNSTKSAYSRKQEIPNVKEERNDDFENTIDDGDDYCENFDNVKTEMDHSVPNNRNDLSAADKLKNFFEHEGIRLPRGTEILLAPVKPSLNAPNHVNYTNHQNISTDLAPLPQHSPDTPNKDEPPAQNYTSYPCSLCDKSFSTKLYLATHLHLHTLESLPEHQLDLQQEASMLPTMENTQATFSCPVCEKSFNMKRYLSNHLRSHNMKLVESDPNFNGESYTCNQCQKSYTKKASFIAHMKAHGDRPFKCEICSRLFKEISSLNVHKSLHSSNSKHQCNVCGLFFKFRSQLKIHEWTHSDNEFTCKFCGKIFRNYFSCKSHENNHVNGKRFICEFCDKAFKYKVALKTHLVTHSRPYKCDSCNRTFDNTVKLENHKKNHLFEKFQLNISEGQNEEREVPVKVEPDQPDDDQFDEMTEQPQLLNDTQQMNFLENSVSYDNPAKEDVDNCLVENMQLHFLEGGEAAMNQTNDIDKPSTYEEVTNGAIYSCRHCMIEFKILEEYQGHMATHEGRADLSCKHCGQPFKRYKKLEKHLRKHNEYKCERCIKSFEIEADLLQHTIYHKDESFKCNYCDSMFTNKYTLQYHIKRHLKRCRCNYCPKSFDNEAQLESHKNTHQSVYKCEYCDKDFKFHSLLVNHMKIHTRPYKCDKCERSFDKSTTLARHQKNTHSPAPFVCHVCDRSFIYESTFNTHLRSHNRQHQCVYCMRSFDDQNRYEKHVKRHEMQYTEFKCEKCNKRFKYQSQLQVHLKNHRNEYKCEECQIQFKHWKSYEKHNRLVHSTEPSTSASNEITKRYKCDKCDKEFKYQSQLQLHLKNHKNVHRCEECQMQFNHWKSYQKHVRLVHEEQQQSEELSCSQCDAKFKYQSQLKHHLESHNRKYACQCGKTFNSKKYFISHEKTHTVDGLKCEICDKEFKYFSVLKLHLKSHEKQCTFQCYHCERIFKSKWKLQRHIESTHMSPNKTPFQCPSCNKSFKYQSQLKTHSSLHERLYKCPKCDRTFNNKRYYVFHKNKHQNVNLTCPQCGKSFDYYSKLSYHMKSHAKGKQTLRKKCSWNCNLCGKRFKFQSLLKNHMMIHEGVKPYKCEYCGKRFAWKSSLQIHSSFVHKHKTRFHCEPCDKYFFYESQYKLHVSTCSWDVTYNCKYCQKQLKSSKTYELHLLKHEGTKQFVCAYCDKGFYTKQVMVNHIKNHLAKETKTCPICGQKFTSEFRYNSHVENHSVEFKCEICDKVFKCKYKLKRHEMMTHQRHTTYPCQICGKLFLREGALMNHQLTHFAQGDQKMYDGSYDEEQSQQYDEEIDVKPDISELGILVPEVIYENHL